MDGIIMWIRRLVPFRSQPPAGESGAAYARFEDRIKFDILGLQTLAGSGEPMICAMGI